jgi:hypothetical protein
MVETTMTKMTAKLIPTEVSIFLETPKNGQIPRKRDKTKLSVRTPAIMMEARWAIFIGLSILLS